jgi:tRNA A37 N6-isopentenylltransferase MiaA
MKFKVLKPFFKLSQQKNYIIDETIELSKEDAEAMLNDGFLEEVKETKTPYEKSKDGTKGIVYKKSIEEVDAEIKEANKNIKND